MNTITIKEIFCEEFNSIKNKIKKEYNENKEHSLPNFVDFTRYTPETYGIYNGKQLLGLFRFKNFIVDKTIEIYILPDFRGLNIASQATDLLIINYGSKYPKCQNFYINISNKNERSLKSIKKGDWIQTHEFDDIMMEEGAGMFTVYYKPNPYYTIEQPPRKLEKIPET